MPDKNSTNVASSYRSVPIPGSKSIYVVGAVFVVLILFAVLTPYYSTKIMSGIRGYQIGEREWSNAHNQAVRELNYYGAHQEEIYYLNFRENFDIMEGKKDARIALTADEPDTDKAYAGFTAGDLNPEYVDEKIWLLLNFSDISYIKNATEIWQQSDQYLERIDELALEIHQKIQNNDLSEDDWEAYQAYINHLDEQITVLTQSFATEINDASYTLSQFIRLFGIFFGFVLVAGGGTIVLTYFRRINKLYEKLVETDTKFRNVLENSRDIIYQMDAEGTRYEYVSPAAEDLLGYTAEEIINKGPSFITQKIHPEDIEELMQDRINIPFADQQQLSTEYRIRKKSGDYIWVNNRKKMLKDHQGNIVGVVGNVTDITNQKKYIEGIDQSLKEKEMLLAEIHHRVKNNLSVIASLLHMQSITSNNEEIRSALAKTQHRIQSISEIHEQLYRSKHLSNIQFDEYVSTLAHNLHNSMTEPGKDITLDIQAEPVKISIKQVIPAGLFLNEVLTNAFKHAFNNRDKGTITIRLSSENDQLTFSIADDGSGIPESQNGNTESLGTTIIQNLTRQLDGSLDVHSNGGTTYKLTFPVKSQKVENTATQ